MLDSLNKNMCMYKLNLDYQSKVNVVSKYKSLFPKEKPKA